MLLLTDIEVLTILIKQHVIEEIFASYFSLKDSEIAEQRCWKVYLLVRFVNSN